MKLLHKKVLKYVPLWIFIPILLASTVGAAAIILLSNTVQTSVTVNGFDYYIMGAFEKNVNYGEANHELFEYQLLTSAKSGYLVFTFTNPEINSLCIGVGNVWVKLADSQTPTEMQFRSAIWDQNDKITIVYTAPGGGAFNFGSLVNGVGDITFDTYYHVVTTQPVDATITISPTIP